MKTFKNISVLNLLLSFGFCSSLTLSLGFLAFYLTYLALGFGVGSAYPVKAFRLFIIVLLALSAFRSQPTLSHYRYSLFDFQVTVILRLLC